MSRKKKPSRHGTSPDVLDVINKKIGMIGLLLAGFTGLMVLAFQQGRNVYDKIILALWPHCFEATLSDVPETVTYGKWPELRFTLEALNRCPDKLGIHVAFRKLAAPRGSVYIESQIENPECRGNVLDNRNCWQTEIPFPRGRKTLSLVPPRLEIPGMAPEREKITIQWYVYNSETKAQLVAHTVDIELLP